MAKSYASPKIRQIVTEAVFRRRRIFVLAFCLVMGTVLLVTLLMPNRYSAEAKLMVQNVRSSAPLSTSPGERLVTPTDVSQNEVNSEVDLLESVGTARRALGMTSKVQEGEQEAKRIDDLQRRLKVEAVHQTNLINVKLAGSSPAAAGDQLQKVIDAYFEERAGAARSSGAEEFFDRQMHDKNQELAQTQQALTDFQVQHRIANLADQKKLQATRIATLQEQLADASTALARQTSKEEAEKRYLSLIPNRLQTTERTITNQYSQERLNTSLVELENRRTELVRLYPPTDRQVVEINEKIATTRQALATAAEHPAAEAASDVNPVWQQLRQQVANSSGELSGLGAQRGQLQTELRDAQTRLKELEEATGPNDELERALTQAQADMTLYAQKRDEARISGELDKEKLFDVSLVQVPIASARPDRPKPLLYMVTGLAFALLFATLLSLYADTSAEQVFTPSQLDALTGSRTLAVLADERDKTQDAANTQVEYRRLLFSLRKALADGSASAAGDGWVSGHDAALAEQPGQPVGYCVGFTSALPGEGTTYVVNNLATVAAKQANSRVAVLDVEALLRKFEAEEDVSFAMKYNTARQHWALALDPSTTVHGPLRTGGVAGQFSTRLNLLLIEGRREFDLLLLDFASFRSSTLASELDQCVDGYVAIVSAGMARRQNVDQMEVALRQSRAPLLGYVLNRRSYPVPQWLHRMLW